MLCPMQADGSYSLVLQFVRWNSSFYSHESLKGFNVKKFIISRTKQAGQTYSTVSSKEGEVFWILNL